MASLYYLPFWISIPAAPHLSPVPLRLKIRRLHDVCDHRTFGKRWTSSTSGLPAKKVSPRDNSRLQQRFRGEVVSRKSFEFKGDRIRTSIGVLIAGSSG